MIGSTKMAKTVKAVLAAGALSSLAVLSHAAPVLTNGDFSSTTLVGAGQMTNTNVTGWTTTSGWTFLNDGVTDPVKNLGATELATKIALSPNGGRFLASDGAYLNGVETTSVTGLTVGTSYKLSFYQGLAQQSFVSNTSAIVGHWDVNLGGSVTPGVSFNGNIVNNGPVFTGGTTLSSTVMNAPHNGFSGWALETLTFTATATTEALNFYATGGPNGLPPFLLLDGVSIAPTVPEPGMLGLAGLGLAGLFFARRRKASAAA